jgi:Flp pilus assembly protein TadD
MDISEEDLIFRTRLRLALYTCLCACICNVAAFADEVASLYSAQGKVEKRASSLAPWNPAQVGNKFDATNACRTGLNSRGAVLFVDGVLIRMNENTLLEFKEAPSGAKRVPIRVNSGAAYFFSREPKRMPQVVTPVVSAAVRGTEFVVEVSSNQTVITVIEGELDCTNASGVLRVGPGEQAVTVGGSAPVKRILVRPWDAVQWALYYPAVLDAAELAGIGFPDAASRLAVDQSVAAYHRGDLSGAFAALETLPQPSALVVQLYQSALYLAVGQVQKAEELLTAVDRSLGTAPAEAQPRLRAVAQSQRAVIAVITNRRSEALALAQSAVTASDQSAAAAMAMSYAQQGAFDLKAARRWTERALQLQPDSATIIARLAELQLGFGELNQAVRIVTEGLKLTPDDSRLLTVAGFAYLTRYETVRAISFFNRAKELDTAAGLPHLGRGLALIRQNKLTEGRRELEIAVHLEPSDSLMRSYLGKAFFEEKRDYLAANEYGLARQLDPFDPTPYLYDAFYKLGNYRPVEALSDIEDSIRLNDNRAVYRSRLLLDQDQAVRSASLAQVFNQIGFADAGRIEAVKSINRDYNNFSAHLLLAGSYFQQPQLNQAVISEELVARLLSPVNINSVRGEASFNEYTSLFDRQRAQFFLLSEGRTADDFIQGAPRVTMAFDGFAAAFVYGARYQGGFRHNDDETLLAPSLLAQYQLTPSDTLSLETVQFQDRAGDTAIGFDPRVNDPDLRRDLDSFTQRLGWHHRFAPGSHLVGQFLYIKRDLDLHDDNEPVLLVPGATQNQAQHIESEGIRAEVQHIWDTPWLSLVTGGSVLSAEDQKQESTRFFILGADFPVNTHGTTPSDGQRAYLYSTWHLGPRVDLTAGAAYSHLEFSELSVPPSDNTSLERDAWEPKAGLTLRVTSTTTLRGAYYEKLGSAGNADLESIEPTQLAGFNQLFDSPVATFTRGAGVGLDQKFAKWTYAGVEAAWRQLDWPFGFNDQPAFPAIGQDQVYTERARERSLRGYVYQVLHRTTTATLEYTLLDREDNSSGIPGPLGDPTPDHSLTHRVRLGLNYFHPRGWFAGLVGTWRHQELKNFELAQDAVANGTRDFWIWDATVGYQFPKRTGYIALTFANLFDRSFLYQPVGIDERFLPDFSVNMRLSLNF